MNAQISPISHTIKGTNRRTQNIFVICTYNPITSTTINTSSYTATIPNIGFTSDTFHLISQLTISGP